MRTESAKERVITSDVQPSRPDSARQRLYWVYQTPGSKSHVWAGLKGLLFILGGLKCFLFWPNVCQDQVFFLFFSKICTSSSGSNTQISPEYPPNRHQSWATRLHVDAQSTRRGHVWDVISRTTFRGGLGCMWPHSFSSMYATCPEPQWRTAHSNDVLHEAKSRSRNNRQQLAVDLI